MITVESKKTTDPYEFHVKVTDSRGGTSHTVTMSESTFQDLTAGKVSPEECIEAAFRFLLDREPKESILSRFDITVISTYFPSFKREFSGYL
jgi:hypothetical protein